MLIGIDVLFSTAAGDAIARPRPMSCIVTGEAEEQTDEQTEEQTEQQQQQHLSYYYLMDLDSRLSAGQHQQQQQRDDDDGGGSDCRSARPVTPPPNKTRSGSCDENYNELVCPVSYRARAEAQQKQWIEFIELFGAWHTTSY